MSTEGVELQVGPRRQPLRATPSARTIADMWLLGSSDYSARLAAEKGLPYVFAHHFSGEGTARRARPLPLVLPAVAGVPRAADLPHRQRRRGGDGGGGPAPRAAQRAADDRAAHRRAAAPAAAGRGGRGRRDDRRPARLGDAMAQRWIVGSRRAGADQIEELAADVRRRRGDGPPGGRCAGRDTPHVRPRRTARRRCACSPAEAVRRAGARRRTVSNTRWRTAGRVCCDQQVGSVMGHTSPQGAP